MKNKTKFCFKNKNYLDNCDELNFLNVFISFPIDSLENRNKPIVNRIVIFLWI